MSRPREELEQEVVNLRDLARDNRGTIQRLEGELREAKRRIARMRTQLNVLTDTLIDSVQGELP